MPKAKSCCKALVLHHPKKLGKRFHDFKMKALKHCLHWIRISNLSRQLLWLQLSLICNFLTKMIKICQNEFIDFNEIKYQYP